MGDRALETATRGAKGRVQMDQTLQTPGAKTREPRTAGNLMLRAPGDSVLLAAGQSFPIRRSCLGERGLTGVLGKSQGERNDRVRDDFRGPAASHQIRSVPRGFADQQVVQVGCGSNRLGDLEHETSRQPGQQQGSGRYAPDRMVRRSDSGGVPGCRGHLGAVPWTAMRYPTGFDLSEVIRTDRGSIGEPR